MLFPPLKLGTLPLPSPLIIAPMAGVTDYPFRVIMREFGAGLSYCEFVAAEGVIREQKRAYDMMRFAEFERPIGIQIFGSKPEVMYECARKIVADKSPDILDINFGCPVPKVAKKGGGAGALRDLSLMKEITEATVEGAGTTPVTVKMRAGWDKDHIIVPDVAPMLEACGIVGLTLHPRTSEKRYADPADWSLIAATKRSVSIPVIGNGDVKTLADLKRLREQTSCDAVMIGRAAMGNPWLIQAMVEHIKDSRAGFDHEPTRDARVAVCKRHLELEIEEMGERIGLNRMRKQFGWYLNKCHDTKPLVHHLVRVKSAAEALSILNSLLEQPAGASRSLAA